MRKFLLGLALLAPFQAVAQTTPYRGQSGYDTGPIVNCTALDGSGAARCLIPGTVIYDNAGAPMGTPANPVITSSGDVTGAGTLGLTTLNATYVIPLTNGRSILAMRLSGLTGSGATITVERSNDGGTTWTSANTTEGTATASLSATITADGQPRIGAAGATNIRLRVSTAGTGTLSIAYNATNAAGPVFLVGNLPSYSTPDGRIIGGVDNRFVAGNTISVGVGAADPGTQRFSLAIDSALIANQTNNTQRTQIVNSGGTAVTLRQTNSAIALTDQGVVVVADTQNYDSVAGGYTGTVGNALGTFIVLRGPANLATTQVSVGTSATLIISARTTAPTRSRLMITQSAAGPCYYGPTSAVSATTGSRLTVAGASKTYQYAGALYGICPGGAVTIDVDEEY